MGPRRDPFAEQDRLRGGGHRADQVGPVDRLLDRGRHLHGQASPLALLLGESERALRPPAPDPHAPQSPHRPHGVQMGARLHARAEDRQVPRAPLRQHPGRHRARRGRADAGDRRGVEERQRLPPLVLEEHHHPLVGLLAVQIVVRHHRDHLDPGDRPPAPGVRRQARQHPRHHRQQAVMVRHPDRRPQRLQGHPGGEGPQGGGDHLDAFVHRQQGFDVFTIQP